MKKLNQMKAGQNSKLAKVLRRLLGDEAGQTMMEYVIIAVVIAAACALIFAIWGKDIFGQAKAAGEATINQPNEASQTVERNRTNHEEGAQEAKENQEKFHGDVKTQTI